MEGGGLAEGHRQKAIRSPVRCRSSGQDGSTKLPIYLPNMERHASLKDMTIRVRGSHGKNVPATGNRNSRIQSVHHGVGDWFVVNQCLHASNGQGAAAGGSMYIRGLGGLRSL